MAPGSPAPVPDDGPTTRVHELMPDAPFREHHARTIAAPIEVVWPACLAVTVREVRLLEPLMAVRTIPAKLRRRKAPLEMDGDGRDRPLLSAFVDEGFVVLRADDAPVDGVASTDFGAAGRFWSLSHNQPLTFDDPEELAAIARGEADRPLAFTIANLVAVDNGDGTTTVTTETRADGTDADARRKFGRYWAMIRLGSGAIRRSWLAGIDRHAVGS